MIARGHVAAYHAGNLRLRGLVDKRCQEYPKAGTKGEKSMLISSIAQSVQDYGRGFVKWDREGMWFEVADACAREKARQM